MPTDHPTEPERFVGVGTEIEAAFAMVADMHAAWEWHMAQERRFQVCFAQEADGA